MLWCVDQDKSGFFINLYCQLRICRHEEGGPCIGGCSTKVATVNKKKMAQAAFYTIVQPKSRLIQLCGHIYKINCTVNLDWLFPARVAQCWVCRTHDLGCEFETWFRQNFYPAYFCLSPLLEACEKRSRWLWKESSVSTGVRKPGNTCTSPTAIIWP